MKRDNYWLLVGAKASLAAHRSPLTQLKHHSVRLTASCRLQVWREHSPMLNQRETSPSVLSILRPARQGLASAAQFALRAPQSVGASLPLARRPLGSISKLDC